MNEAATLEADERPVSVPMKVDPVKTTEVGMSTGIGGTKIAPQNLGEVIKFSEVMCRAGKALPSFLRGDQAACLAVAMQAFEWQMNPFAVANKAYFVNDRLAFEAQMIAAVVNTRSPIKGRLRYDYQGEGVSRQCIVTGILDGDTCELTTPMVQNIKPKNSPLWASDPDQQLAYYGARAWARRHCPEVILGAYDREEAESMGPDTARDVTPKSSGLADRLKDGSEGFDADRIASDLDGAKSDNSTTEKAKAKPEDDQQVIDGEAKPVTSEELETKTASQLTIAGAKAAKAGEGRVVPDELSDAEAKIWLTSFDRVTAQLLEE